MQAPVQLLRNHHGSCVGAAWVAAMAAGQVQRWEDIAALVPFGDRVLPDPTNAEIYRRGHADFRALYPGVRPFFRRAT